MKDKPERDRRSQHSQGLDRFCGGIYFYPKSHEKEASEDLNKRERRE